MKDKIIKSLQKILNSQFTYQELFNVIDTNKDFLTQSNIISKTDESEYNAIWDTIICIEDYFRFAKHKPIITTSSISVNKIFEYNYDQRLNNRTAKD